jgi:hypothetical protein
VSEPSGRAAASRLIGLFVWSRRVAQPSHDQDRHAVNRYRLVGLVLGAMPRVRFTGLLAAMVLLAASDWAITI